MAKTATQPFPNPPLLYLPHRAVSNPVPRARRTVLCLVHGWLPLRSCCSLALETPPRVSPPLPLPCGVATTYYVIHRCSRIFLTLVSDGLGLRLPSALLIHACRVCSWCPWSPRQWPALCVYTQPARQQPCGLGLKDSVPSARDASTSFLLFPGDGDATSSFSPSRFAFCHCLLVLRRLFLS